MSKRLPIETRNRIIELHESGWWLAKIARELSIPESSVLYWLEYRSVGTAHREDSGSGAAPPRRFSPQEDHLMMRLAEGGKTKREIQVILRRYGSDRSVATIGQRLWRLSARDAASQEAAA